MPDPSPPSDSNAPEPAAGQTDAAPPTVLAGVSPEELYARGMGTAKMSGSAGGMWQPPSIEEAARLFPNYEVLSLLGRGGMGAVYQARQIELDRLVAIKLLPLEISVDADFAERFRREARAMAKLNHPNIITVFDFGTTTEGHLFFAMEFVDGANLHAIIHGPGLDPQQALAITIQVCEALAYAHEQGVVHRDVKPANVMVDQRGRAKVADFGLARLTDSGAEQSGQTMTGTIMGTPDYMAPEQMKGMHVDHRADIYALGVMLYEMLCKDIPRGFFDPPSQRAGVDARLDDVVKRAMQQLPERRYQQTTEMRTDVDGIRATMVAPTPSLVAAVASTGGQRAVAAASRGIDDAMPSKPPRKSKLGLALAFAAAVLIIGALAFMLMQPAKPKEKIEKSAAPQKISATPLPAKVATPVARPAATPAPAAAAAEQWVDGLAEWWAKSPDASKGLLVKEAGGSRIVDGSRGIFIGNGRDIAVRATAQGVKGASWRLGLRANQNSYFVGLATSGGANKIFAEKTGILQDLAIPPGFSVTDRHTVELRAQGDLITVLLDGEQVAQMRDTSIKESGRVFVSGAKGMLIEKFEYRLLAPAAAPAPVAPSDGPWVDALAEYWQKQPGSKADALTRELGGSRRTKSAGAVRLASHRDIAVRATVSECDGLRFQFRFGKDGNYWVEIPGTNICTITRFVGSAPTDLKTFNRPPGFSLRDRHTIEARIQGDTLTCIVDGQEMARVQDATLQAKGSNHFVADAGTLIEKLEYRELPASTPGPAAVPSTSTGSTSATPATATKDAPFVNTLGMKFVPVPIIGGPTGGQRVLFSVWETRVQDYEVFATETKRPWPKPTFEQGPTHPAVMVSWDDAQAFCAWLTGKERSAGRLAGNEVYRLPSDHEWSCAVGIGEQEDAAKTPVEKSEKIADVFPWGSAWPPPAGAGNYAGEELQPALAAGKYSYIKMLPGYRDAYPETAPVGSLGPDRLGLCDLGGNAFEWCEDWYEDKKEHRVLRGAAWNFNARGYLLSSGRAHYAPGGSSDNSGFRPVLAPANP